MTTQFINPRTNTAIKVEVAKPDWFKKFLADDSHMSLRIEEYTIPKPQILPISIPSTNQPAISRIERLSLSGEFDSIISPRSFFQAGMPAEPRDSR